MKAIAFELQADKTLLVRYGESSFKKIDEFWTDFTPNGSKVHQMTFLPNIIRYTEKNDELVQQIGRNYAEQKFMNDEYDKKMYQLRNQFEK